MRSSRLALGEIGRVSRLNIGLGLPLFQHCAGRPQGDLPQAFTAKVIGLHVRNFVERGVALFRDRGNRFVDRRLAQAQQVRLAP